MGQYTGRSGVSLLVTLNANKPNVVNSLVAVTFLTYKDIFTIVEMARCVV